jgi:hypothetical protein
MRKVGKNKGERAGKDLRGVVEEWRTISVGEVEISGVTKTKAYVFMCAGWVWLVVLSTFGAHDVNALLSWPVFQTSRTSSQAAIF